MHVMRYKLHVFRYYLHVLRLTEIFFIFNMTVTEYKSDGKIALLNLKI